MRNILFLFIVFRGMLSQTFFMARIITDDEVWNLMYKSQPPLDRQYINPDHLTHGNTYRIPYDPHPSSWGHPECVFPFEYKEDTYTACTMVDSYRDNTPWCATTSIYNSRYYVYCEETFHPTGDFHS